MYRDIRGIECESGRFAGARYGRYRELSDKLTVHRVYDDGNGPLWIYQDAGGLLAIVRASSWEDAWSVCEDEIFDDADQGTIDDHYRTTCDEYRNSDPKYCGLSDDDILETGAIDLPEGHGYRPNGSGSNEWNKTGIYQEDLNGSELRLLTYDDLENHGIVISWQSWGDK